MYKKYKKCEIVIFKRTQEPSAQIVSNTHTLTIGKNMQKVLYGQ